MAMIRQLGKPTIFTYHYLCLPLFKSSRGTVFIITNKINENKQLKDIDSNYKDIYMPNIIDKYIKRSRAFENLCLADYVANYKKENNQLHSGSENEDDSEGIAKKRSTSIIRYRRYKLAQDPYNYYREQLLLFLPFRNEFEEIENINTEHKFHNNILIIKNNSEKYSILQDEVLDEAIDHIKNENVSLQVEEIQNYIDDELSNSNKVDIMEQCGNKIASKYDRCNRFSTPQRISKEKLLLAIKNLNDAQREIVMHVFNSFKTGSGPLRIFLSGSAGVGKSTVVNCIYQLITHYFDNQPGEEKQNTVVLLCAPTGKAAFLIGGITLHTAFALPVTQFGDAMPELSNDIANTVRLRLSKLKLLIICEISTVGSTLFSRVDIRLRQIMGVNKSFGGLPVIVVGDLNQLPPVMDSPIYKLSKKHGMNMFLNDPNPLWDEFQLYELTEVMRQKNEFALITALNNLAIGELSIDDVNLFNSRVVNDSDVPNGAIRLFAENSNVDFYNKLKLDKFPGDEYISKAKDNIRGKVSEDTKERVLESLKKRKITEVNGLPYILRLKIGIKYMITYNIDVEDGLVTGACGTLKFIGFKPNSNEPNQLWIDFNSELVGRKKKTQFKELIKKQNLDIKLTPIEKNTTPLNLLKFQIIRSQFPLTPAEAITIHKSQGQTYDEVCLDFIKSRRMSRQMMYVGLSRVKSLAGLYIIGNFKCPKSNKKDNLSLEELNKLRTVKKLKLSFNNLKSEKEGIKIFDNTKLDINPKNNVHDIVDKTSSINLNDE